MQRRTLAARWWNGTFGRLARRDIWLWHEPDGSWTLEICRGGIDSGQRARERFTDEAPARAMLQRAVETGGSGWRELPTS